MIHTLSLDDGEGNFYQIINFSKFIFSEFDLKEKN